MDIGGDGEPKDLLRRSGESMGGANPLGLGEKMAGVIVTGEVASPAAVKGRNILAAEPGWGGMKKTHVHCGDVGRRS